MIHIEEINCPYCRCNDLQKNGKNSNGLQRWHCKSCGKYFQREYRYNARKQGTYEKIIELTLNSSGVRDTGRILKINKNRVVAVFKKNAKNESLLSDGSRTSNT
jgi:transposase-like protein